MKMSYHFRITLSIIIGIILVVVGILVWANQTGRITIFGDITTTTTGNKWTFLKDTSSTGGTNFNALTPKSMTTSNNKLYFVGGNPYGYGEYDKATWVWYIDEQRLEKLNQNDPNTGSGSLYWPVYLYTTSDGVVRGIGSLPYSEYNEILNYVSAGFLIENLAGNSLNNTWSGIANSAMSPLYSSIPIGTGSTTNGSSVYIVGGYTLGAHSITGNTSGSYSNKMNYYNTGTNSWNSVDLPFHSRAGVSTALVPAKNGRDGSRIYVYGGNYQEKSDGTSSFNNNIGGETFYDDVWYWDEAPGGQWHQVTPQNSGPGNRAYGNWVYDSIGDQLIYFGGKNSTSYFNDTWSLKLSEDGYESYEWNQLAVGSNDSTYGLLPRAFFSMTYNNNNGKIYLLGGGDNSGGINDLWEYTLPTTITPITPTSTSCNLTASSETVNADDGVVLTWTSSGYQYASINGGTVPLNGSNSYYPTQTTTYQLVCWSPGGAQSSVNVNVNGTTQETGINTFTVNGADSATVEYGDEATLAWTTSGLDDISQGTAHAGMLELKCDTMGNELIYYYDYTHSIPNGNRTKTFTENATCTLKAWKDANVVNTVTTPPVDTKTVSITVTGVAPSDPLAPPMPTGLSATADPNDCTKATLNWTASTSSFTDGYAFKQSTQSTPEPNALIGGVVGADKTNGTLTGLSGGTTYYAWIQAYNNHYPDDNGASYSASAGPVSFTTKSCTTAPIISTFEANPQTLTQGQSSTLSWTVTGATSLSINNGVGDVTGKTSISVSPTQTTTYILTATNSSGSTTSTPKTVTVNEPGSNNSVINSFTANPLTINSGQSTTLSWNVSNADSVSIDNGIGNVSASGTQSVSPTTNTTYTLTATNSSGTVTATVPITVLDNGHDTTPPTAPSSANSSSVTSNGATINWTVSTDNVGVTGYDIYNADNDQLIGTTADTSITLAGLTCNTTYRYYIKAHDAAGNQSEKSNTVEITTGACAEAASATGIAATLAKTSKLVSTGASLWLNILIALLLTAGIFYFLVWRPKTHQK